MRYPFKDKFWGWRMDPFEVFAYWDSRRTSPNWHCPRVHIAVWQYKTLYCKGEMYVTQIDVCLFL